MCVRKSLRKQLTQVLIRSLFEEKGINGYESKAEQNLTAYVKYICVKALLGDLNK